MVFRHALGITPGAYRAAALQEDRTAAQIVDGPRDELFAGSCLQDQDAGVCGGHDRDHIQGGLQGGAPADDVPELGASLLLEIASLGCLFVPVLYRLSVVQRVLNRDGDLAGNLFQKGDIIVENALSDRLRAARTPTTLLLPISVRSQPDSRPSAITRW